jgi:outer membrane protein OmpA-like peptidoglycan-associated protein
LIPTKNKIVLLNFILLLSACVQAPSDPVRTTHNLAPSNAHIKKNALPVIQMIQSDERLRVILYSDGCFQKDGSLTTPCARQLGTTIRTIKRYGNGLIQVVGYTDDIYDPRLAEAISQQQARVVATYLYAKGISLQRLRAIGFGNHNSIASNRDVHASAANRRVEITLVKN